MSKMLNLTCPHLRTYDKYTKIVPATDYVRTLNHNMPELPYNITSETHNQLHNRQRKLLLSEIEFLVNNYDKYKDLDDVIIVYIGAALGQHIHYLTKLFPNFQYHLYDKIKFYNKLHSNKKVTIFNRYFDNIDANRYNNQNVIMISDMRDINIMTMESSNDMIINDMNEQMSYYLTMKPITALLKFRLPWTDGETKYLDGTIYYNTWQGAHSTETRLVPNGNICTYNNTKYESQLFYFNTIIRRQYYEHDLSSEYYGNCYDCFTESMILTKYCNLMVACEDDNIKKEIYKIRRAIDKALNRPLF